MYNMIAQRKVASIIYCKYYLFSKAKKEGTQEELSKFKNLTKNKLQDLN